MKYKITKETVHNYLTYLRNAERSAATICKYKKAILEFYISLPEDKRFDKEFVLRWKEAAARSNAVSTVNGKVAALNGLFAFSGWHDCRIKPLKQQKKVFRAQYRDLTRKDYLHLLAEAKRGGDARLYLLMQTLSSTGMRVSELQFVTVEALANGFSTVRCKGKSRTIMLTKKLRRVLQNYCRRQGIQKGAVFVTRTGRPLDRSNIWRALQKLCRRAKVEARKVFPHNFRHLFAVAFYQLKKDIAKLADLLGHASIETTRIYIMESGAEHERQIERLGFVI